MGNKNKHSLGREDGFLEDAPFGGSPAPELDPADYLPDMEGFAMTEAQKIELLETLWPILRSLVELGIDLDEVDPCGQIFSDFAPDSLDGVTSSFRCAASAHSGHNHNNKEDAPA